MGDSNIGTVGERERSGFTLLALTWAVKHQRLSIAAGGIAAATFAVSIEPTCRWGWVGKSPGAQIAQSPWARVAATESALELR